MKTRLFVIFLLMAGFGFILSSCNSVSKNNPVARAIASAGRSEILFDDGWKFSKGTFENAESPGFNDSSWRIINLPHDWSIEDLAGTESPFDSSAIGGIDAGYLDGGTGFYRKSFFVPSNLRDKKISLLFEGVYMNSTTWLNGELLGNHPYGYTSFRFDITDKLKPGAKNVITVKVSNEGRNSRWYSGSGIYRHVWLNITEAVHLDPWNIDVTADLPGNDNALVTIKQTVFNDLVKNTEIKLVTTIFDDAGKLVLNKDTSLTAGEKSYVPCSHTFMISNPSLWSTENASLYKAVSEIYTINPDGTNSLSDKVETEFGIRSLSFSPENGFLLNGKHVLIKGGCMHHDNGPLGAAAFDRAEERRVEIMKANGFNAIRCSHNPPSPAFLRACDKLGMMVIDEAFDMWTEPKNKDDYHNYFNEWWQKDVESMVMRDRNHPSVILWSIGNEIPESGNAKGAEIAQKIASYIRQLDPSRKITSAVNSVSEAKDPYFSALDVCGYNYAIDNYVKDHKRMPGRIMVATESYALEAYEYWMAVLDHPWVIGDFVWTGYDYLGEASIGWLGYPHEGSFYPWNHAYCGDIDLCGFKRPQSYYRDVLWGNGKDISIFVKPPVPSFELNPKKEVWSKWEWQDVVPSWNWEGNEGKEMEVEVYSSCPEVELLLNNKSLGKQKSDRNNKWITRWKVPYAPGVLKALGSGASAEPIISELKTAGKPVKVILSADRNSIKAGGQDLCYITAELVDENNLRSPLASEQVKFEIQGQGTIIAVGSSDPRSTESFQRPYRKAYKGRCIAIIRSAKDAGDIVLKGQADGLQSSEIRLKAI